MCTYAAEHGACLLARAALRVLLVGRRGGRRRRVEHASVRVLLALLASLEARLELLELQLHRLQNTASANAVQWALAQEKDEEYKREKRAAGAPGWTHRAEQRGSARPARPRRCPSRLELCPS